MEGKLFYGKTTSPKVIAEASLAYSFSFDLQRFDGGWSIGADGGDHAGKYIFGNGTNSVASLFADTTTNYVWSIAGASTGTITLDLNSTNSVIADPTLGINASIRTSGINSLTAADLNASFHLKLASDTALVSILGSSKGDSIDASAVTHGMSISGGADNDTLIAGSSGKFYLDGGAGDDSLIAGSAGSTLFGGEGNDSLYGGNGVDYFVYGGSGIDSIFNYTTGQDFISLTSGAELPGVASVKTATGSDALILDFGTNNSLAVVGASVTTATVGLINGTDTYYYNKDYIQLGKNVSLTSDVTSFNSFNTGSIDATGVTVDAGVWINSYGNTVIGSNTEGTSVFGGAGNDFVSLAGSQVDIFVYNGKGSASIEGLGSSGFVSLSAKNAALIRDGSALESINGGHEGKDFKLTFGTNNALTFIDSDSASIKVGDNALIYTPTAISIAGADNGSSITLGSSYDSSSFAGTGYSVISAAAVSVSNESSDYFAVSGGHTSNLIWGSDRQVTSILGGSGADTLYAGKAGASLVSNGGADLLIGNTSGEDTFIYTGNGNATIRNYTYGTDVVSVTGDAVPTTDITKINLESGTSNFHISLGGSTDSVLTFESSTKVDIVSLGASSLDTYHYENDRIIVNTDRITLGPAYTTRNFNVNSTAFEGYALSSIDASAVTVANGINITARAGENNSVIGAQFGGRIIGSEYADYLQSGVTADASIASLTTTTIDAGAVGSGTYVDSLVGGEGNDWFIYRGAQASIGSYTSGKDSIQIVGFNMLGDDVPTFASLSNDEESSDLVLTFGTGSSLSIAGGANAQSVVTFRNGSHTLEYGAGIVSIDSKSVILTKDYQVAPPGYIATGSITTVDASSVTSGVVSLGANDDYNTRLIGSTSKGNSLVSGAKNDYLTGGNAADVFVYTAGKDTVSNYAYSQNDSLVADSFIGSIKSGKVSGTKLIFTGTDKKNVLTFLSEDDAVEKVSIGGADNAGYLTKDGYVETGGSGDSLKLFSSARDEIELSAAPYSVTGAHAITTVNAADVAQSITLIPGSLSSAATYILPGNKRRDRFEYAGGAVSISGYESGKDQLNLGIGTISGFSVVGGSGDVLLTVSGSSSNVISVSGGSDKNFLVHQSTDRSSTYRKMAFTHSGILTDKASKPTTVTVLGGADSLDANEDALGGGTIKKIYAISDAVKDISITASDKNNTIINMGVAGSGVSIYGGKKNDKITGSNTEGDLFVYRTDSSGAGGKDVVTNFSSESDIISLGADPNASLSNARIIARNKAVAFKFNNKNSLNLKSSENISAVTVASSSGNTAYTFGRNAFSTTGGSEVSLTSAFGGTFNTSTKVGDSAATKVDGSQINKNLTFKGSSSGETLIGGSKKTTFKAGGGADSLVGGSGKDVFFYARNDAGTTTIADFDYENDKIKLTSGTLAKIETISSGGVRLAMKDSSGNNVGWYEITSAASYNNGTKTPATTAPGANTVFKANNTYYWFAPGTVEEQVTVSGSDGTTTTVVASAGQLVTTDTRVSASKVSDYDVIELNYATNLVRAGIAVASSKATLPAK